MFIHPMRCTTFRDPSRLGDPRYMAEPKFDGQGAHVHVAGGRMGGGLHPHRLIRAGTPP
jgi:hypothetical protein